MSNSQKLGVTSPLGDLVIAYRGQEISFLLNEKGSATDVVWARASLKKVSPVLPEGMNVDTLYLITISIKALENVSGASLDFSLENNKADDQGSSDSGEHFESILWGNNDYIAHCGFRTTIDAALGSVDDFDRLDMEWTSAGLRLILPDLQKGDDIIFHACFAWAKKTKDDDVSTWYATESALPMKKQI